MLKAEIRFITFAISGWNEDDIKRSTNNESDPNVDIYKNLLAIKYILNIIKAEQNTK